MKKALSIILALLIIAQMMVNVGIGVYYHLNKTYIANQLCINKNNPSLHCNGHCYLSKQLKKAEEGERKSTRALNQKDEIFSHETFASVLNYFPAYTITHYGLYLSASPLAGNYNSLVKPPAA